MIRKKEIGIPWCSILQKDRIVYGRPLHPWGALNEILSWCMPAKRIPPISVLGVLTINGWDERQKEFGNLYQTQTIGKDLHEEHSVSVRNDGDTIKSCSKYNVDEKHVTTALSFGLNEM